MVRKPHAAHHHGICSSPEIVQSPVPFSPRWFQGTEQPDTSCHSGFPYKEHAPSLPSSLLLSLQNYQLSHQAAGAGAAATLLTLGCTPCRESQSGSAVQGEEECHLHSGWLSTLPSWLLNFGGGSGVAVAPRVSNSDHPWSRVYVHL